MVNWVAGLLEVELQSCEEKEEEQLEWILEEDAIGWECGVELVCA